MGRTFSTQCEFMMGIQHGVGSIRKKFHFLFTKGQAEQVIVYSRLVLAADLAVSELRNFCMHHWSHLEDLFSGSYGGSPFYGDNTRELDHSRLTGSLPQSKNEKFTEQLPRLKNSLSWSKWLKNWGKTNLKAF